MLTKQKVTINLSDKWFSFQGIYVRGTAFLKDKLLKGNDLARYLYGVPDEDKMNSIRSLNGFFAVVRNTDHDVYIATDKISSIPLFYSNYEDDVVISDDPYWIKDNFPDNRRDEMSELELLLLGYVTGEYTLSKGVRQVRAAEIIRFEDIPKSEQYFDLPQLSTPKTKKTIWVEKHYLSLVQAFTRLIAYCDGRPIVIPLSGGYDSRLVALMLKKLNYENVITFSYGIPDNPEAIVSQQVAKNLNFRWLFVPYDNSKTFRWFNSNERKEYGKAADNLCSILLDREFPAVWELKKNNLIPDDAVFVPGHGGDFGSGMYIPTKIGKRLSKGEVIEEIFKKHYVMWDSRGLEPILRVQLDKRIAACLDLPDSEQYHDPLFFIRKFSWQERTAKYLANSVKIYDFWGYDWWLPFWDTEYAKFWCQVPVKWKRDRRLYKHHVIKLYSEIAGIKTNRAKIKYSNLTSSQKVVDLSKRIIRVLPFGAMVEKFVKRYKHTLREVSPNKQELYETDWQQSYGRMTRELYEKLLPYIIGRSSCTTLERLRQISYTDHDASKDVLEILRKMRGN